MTQAKNFAFGEDEKMLRDTARKFLQDNLPTDKLHQLVASDSDPYRESACLWDQDLWQHIVELGWTTVIVPEADGGMGMTLVALCALLEECGRVALPSPFLATANPVSGRVAVCRSVFVLPRPRRYWCPEPGNCRPESAPGAGRPRCGGFP